MDKNTAKIHLPFSVPVMEFTLEMPYVDMLNTYADKITADEKKSKELDWSKNLVGNVKQEHAIEEEVWMQTPQGTNTTLLEYMNTIANAYMDQ